MDRLTGVGSWDSGEAFWPSGRFARIAPPEDWLAVLWERKRTPMAATKLSVLTMRL